MEMYPSIRVWSHRVRRLPPWSYKLSHTLLMGVFVMSAFVFIDAQQPLARHDERMRSSSADAPRSFVVTKAFVSGGSVDFDTNNGDVRIVRSVDESQIRLEAGVEDNHLSPAQAQERWLTRMVVEGSHASIELHLPAGRAAGAVTLYVPGTTSLVVKMKAGRLTVNGVKGDKNLNLGTGTLTLRESDPSSYQHIRADVGVGLLTDGVFHGKESGVLGRKLSVDGKGKYQLALHVGNGEIVLTEEDGGL